MRELLMEEEAEQTKKDPKKNTLKNDVRCLKTALSDCVQCSAQRKTTINKQRFLF